MRSVVILLVGLVLLAVCLLIGRGMAGASGGRTAVIAFIPFWVACAAVNMYIGVARAGYSVAEEAPIFALIAAIPAAAALLLRYKLLQ